MRKTALYDLHVSRGGRMVPFAGWSMPLHYGSQLEEHHIVRQTVGLFDVSHMQLLSVKGSNATLFLRNLLANDVQKLYPGKALYTCLLNEAGGIKDDLIAYQITAEHYILVVNAATAEQDLIWMQSHANEFSVEVSKLENRSLIAIQGPGAKMLVEKANFYAHLKPFHCYQHADYFIARTGYTGEDGFEISVPNERADLVWSALLELGAMPCGLGARDTLRLEAGLNLYGQDMDETTNPFESNLTWTVDLKDEGRHFIGRSALEQHLQDGIQRQLVGLVLIGPGVMRSHMSIYSKEDESPLGVITSGGFSPTLNCSIAFARIRRMDVDGLHVDLRQKRHDVCVVVPPFVRAGQPTFDLK